MIIDDRRIQLGEHELVLRCAATEDAQMLINYLKTTCGETRYLAKDPEEITFTIEEESAFIEGQNASEKNLMLLGFLDGEYVGNCSFMGNALNRYRHRASMGVALYQKYTRLGIGTAMIKTLCEVAKEHGIEQMELEVVADNTGAISLYEKLGFEILGRFPNNMKYLDGTYADAYWMMKRL